MRDCARHEEIPQFFWNACRVSSYTFISAFNITVMVEKLPVTNRRLRHVKGICIRHRLLQILQIYIDYKKRNIALVVVLKNLKSDALETYKTISTCPESV